MLFDLRYKTTPQWTRIVLRLSNRVQVKRGDVRASGSLPKRVFFDLSPCRVPRKWRAASFSMQGGQVQRVRLGMHRDGRTRVVLEIKGQNKVRLTRLRKPERLVIDVALENQFPWPARRRDLLPTRVLESSRVRRSPKVILPKRWRGSGLHQSRLKGIHPRSAFAFKPPPKQMPFAFPYRRVVIDAGHGGLERGTRGLRSGMEEKNITLDLALRVYRRLRRLKGVKVFLTRRRDRTLPLFQRLQVIRRFRPDLVVSLHINAHPDPRVNGITTYYMSGGYRQLSFRHFVADNLLRLPLMPTAVGREHDLNWIMGTLRLEKNIVISRILGQTIQQSIIRHLHRRGYKQVKSLGLRRALFFLLYSTGVPAVLVESSFLSNPMEEKLLRTSRYRGRIADGIARGLRRFLLKARLASKKQRSQLPR